MRYDPVLASRNLPAGTDGYRVPLVAKVTGGLHFIRGNHAPYFSVTLDQHRRGNPDQCQSGGAAHERIEALFPGRFADLIALHLSDIDGEPMHAEANGWYLLAGALGGAGERYHAGNADTYGRLDTSTDGCLMRFADHCRIDRAEAERIYDAVRKAATRNPEPEWGAWETDDRAPDWKAGRAEWSRIMETMRPRWKAEADAAIARHHLRVFGDPWPVPA